MLFSSYPLLELKDEARSDNLPKLYILLAEDNPLICTRSIKNLFEQQGHDIMVAEDGSKALLYLKTYSYDWGLLDLVFPEIDGIDLVKNYRAWEKQINRIYMPLFGLTAYPFGENGVNL